MPSIGNNRRRTKTDSSAVLASSPFPGGHWCRSVFTCWRDGSDPHKAPNGGPGMAHAGGSVAQRMLRFLVLSVRTVSLVLLYYCFSIGITFYQKWFIKDFHFPLFVVTCHLIVKLVLASLWRFSWELLTGQKRITLEWQLHIKRLACTGIASALDIGFSNWSFEFITVSLYTMTKSTCIIFILIFSIAFGLEKKRCSLVFVILLIAGGLFMFTYKSTQFQPEGFLLVLGASFLGGLRWTMAQLIMQRQDIGLSNPVDMIYHVQPWMILGLLPVAIAFEGIPLSTETHSIISKDTAYLVQTVVKILLGAVLAFLMEVSEYLLLSYTSSLTLSIAGIVKEVFTLYIAVIYNKDQMNAINFVGLIVCLTGIAVHVILRAIDSSASVAEEASIGNGESSEMWQRLLEGGIDDEEEVLFQVPPHKTKAASAASVKSSM